MVSYREVDGEHKIFHAVASVDAAKMESVDSGAFGVGVAVNPLVAVAYPNSVGVVVGGVDESHET